jgi:hypothetical protein
MPYLPVMPEGGELRGGQLQYSGSHRSQAKLGYEDIILQWRYARDWDRATELPAMRSISV